jgi:hypothetical protein
MKAASNLAGWAGELGITAGNPDDSLALTALTTDEARRPMKMEGGTNTVLRPNLITPRVSRCTRVTV